MQRSSRLLTAVSLSLLTAVGGVGLVAAPAHAEATRTWVSGVGDDANPCTRTAPCKTWAGAISRTSPGGTINALDSAGFGAVTITKSIQLVGTGTLASSLSTGMSGITIVNPNADVVLRDLDVTGTDCAPGKAGVHVRAARSVVLDGVVVSGFDRGVWTPADQGGGPTPMDLAMHDVSITGSCTSGVELTPQNGQQVAASLDGVRVIRTGTALRVGQGAEAWVKNSTLGRATTALSVATGAAAHSMCGNVLLGAGSFTDVSSACVAAPVQAPVRYCTVPATKKLTLARAKSRLVAAGCAVGKVSRKKARKAQRGKVLSQDVRAGVQVRRGTKVDLVLGR